MTMTVSTSAVRRPRLPFAIALEPRLMYDGAAVGAVAEWAAHDGTWHGHGHEGGTDGHGGASAAAYWASKTELDYKTVTPPAVSSGTDGAGRDVVIIDGNVTDPQALAAMAPAGAEVYILDPNEDGLAQVSRILGRAGNVAELQIISHGGDGYFLLGNDVVSTDTASYYAAAFKSWQKALEPGADILFYGCDMAAGPSGQQLLSDIAGWTGANIAANTGITGKDGDWALNYQIGTIQDQMFNGEGYQYDLGTLEVTNLNDSGAGSLRAELAIADAASGDETIIFDPSLFTSGAQTLTLTSGALTATDSHNLTILGPGANLLTIDANYNSQIFYSKTTGQLTLSGMTLTRGSSTGTGGAIYAGASGGLTLTNMIIKDSKTTGGGTGGGVYFYGSGSATFLMQNSMLYGCSSANRGGGIYASAACGTVNIVNSTLFNNTDGITSGASDEGGAVCIGAESVLIQNDTFYGNTAGSGAAIAIANDGKSQNAAIIRNSTFAKNNVTNTTVEYSGTIAALGTAVKLYNNIISGNTQSAASATIGGTTGLFVSTPTGVVTGDYNAVSSQEITTQGSITLTHAVTASLNLGTFGAHGGFVKTVSLLSGSSAIAAGTATDAPTDDACGYVRSSIDLGAYAYDTNGTFSLTGPTFVPDNYSDVPRNIELQIDFGMAVTAASGNIVIHNNDNSVYETIPVGNVIIGDGLATGSLVTIPLTTELAASTSYYVTIDSGAFTDASSRTFTGISSNSDWAFTTGAATASYPFGWASTSSPSTTYTDAGDNASSYSNYTGTATTENPAGSVTYGITGGTDASGSTTLVGSYGTLVISDSTGAYTYTPSAAEINALQAGSTPTDTFTITAYDGTTTLNKTLTVNLTGANDPPVVTAGGSGSYTQNAAAVAADGGTGIVVTDVDNTTEKSATITISSGYETGDTLSFSGSYGDITAGSFNTTTDALTLTSASGVSLATWESALDAVKFATSDGTAASRTISWVVDDGGSSNHASTAATSSIAVSVPPAVSSIDRTGASTVVNGTSEEFTVVFNQSVTGVDESTFTNFSVTTTGTVGDTGISSITGSGTTYTVTVSGITGAGTLGLDLTSDGSINHSGTALTTTHTGDQTYTIDNTAATNSVAPSFTDTTSSGAYKVGDTLTANVGTWSQNSAAQTKAYTYQWQYSTDNSTWNDITSSGTSSTFVLTSSQAHDSVRLEVSEGDGTQPASSLVASTAQAVANTAPGITTSPVIELSTGSGGVGSVFDLATPAAFSDADGDTVTTTYTWYYSATGSGTIGGAGWTSFATGTTSGTVTSTEAHDYIAVVASGNDTYLTTTAPSTNKIQLTNTAPNNTVAPSITGTVYVGDALTANTGTWADADGDSRTTHYYWYTTTDSAGTQNKTQVGSGDASYTPVSGNQGKYLELEVVTTDGHTGSTTVDTTPTLVLPPQPTISGATYDPGTGVLTISGTNLGTDTIDPTRITITGDSGNSFTLSSELASSSAVAASSGSVSFTIQAGADLAAVNAILDKNGSTGLVVTSDAFTLSATGTWDTTTSSGQTDQTGKTVSVTESGTPSVTINGSQTYVERASAVTLDGTTSVSDTALTGLTKAITGATVTISANQASGDTLAFVNELGITGSWNGTDTLTLSGTTSLANYITALDSITFANSTNHDPTASSTTRTIGWQVTDIYGKNSTTQNTTLTITPINDPPTATVTAQTPTYTESGSGVNMFSVSAITPVEAAQYITSAQFTVSGIVDGDNEVMGLDGSTGIKLDTNASTQTTTSGNVTYTVAYSAGTATVTLTATSNLTSGSQSTSDSSWGTILSGITYKDTLTGVTTGTRTATLVSITDNGGTANGGSATDTINTASTVTVASINHAPDLSATANTSLTFTEGGTAATLFSAASADLGTNDGSSGQTIKEIDLTVTNVQDGASEILTINGTAVGLNTGNSVTSGGYTFAVTNVSGNTEKVAITKSGNIAIGSVSGLITGITYKDTSNDPHVSGNRVVTLTSIQDSGGGASGGTDTNTSIGGTPAATVTVQAIDNPPTITATAVGGSTMTAQASTTLFNVTALSAVESAQYINKAVITVTGLATGTDGASEQITIDGSTVALETNTTGHTTTNGNVTYDIAYSAGSATITLHSTNLAASTWMTTVLNGLAYKDNAVAASETAGARTFTLSTITDDGSTANGGSNSTTVNLASTVTLTANDTPAITVPGGASATEGAVSQKTLSGASFTDANGTTYTVTLSSSNPAGLIHVDGVTADSGANDSSTITFHGTSTAMNTALGTLKYTAGGFGSDTITVQVADDGTTMIAGAKTGTATIMVTETKPTPPPAQQPQQQAPAQTTPTPTTPQSNDPSGGDTGSAGLQTIVRPNANTNTGSTTVANAPPPTTLSVAQTSAPPNTATSTNVSLTGPSLNAPTLTGPSIFTGPATTTNAPASAFSLPTTTAAPADNTPAPTTTTTTTAPVTTTPATTAPAATAPVTTAPASTSPAPATVTTAPAAASQAVTAPTVAPVLTAPSSNTFQVAVAARPTGGGDALVVNAAVKDSVVADGAKIAVTIPSDAFAATRSNAQVTLAATRADGAALPGWMAFNPQTGTFEGTPPPGFKGEVVVKVVARDEQGHEAVQTFKIVVGEANQGRMAPGQDNGPPQGQPADTAPGKNGDAGHHKTLAHTAPLGRPGLLAQAKAMTAQGRLAKQTALIDALRATGRAA